MKLSHNVQQEILELQKKYPEKRSALIPALHLAQNEIGYLPLSIQAEVATLFGIAPNEVNAVVTFYDMFFEEPVGRHIIHVCKNLSCMLRGGDDLLKSFCKKLNVLPRQNTSDQEFTIIPSECLGACDKAPCLLLDDELKGPVKLNEIDQLLAEAKKMKGHPSPVEVLESSHG